MDGVDSDVDQADEVEVLRHVIESMARAIAAAEMQGYDGLVQSLRAVKQHAESMLGNPPSINPQ